MIRKVILSLSSAVLVVGFAPGCGGTGRTGNALVENVEALTEATAIGDFNALATEGDTHWAARSSREETLAAIDAWTRAIAVETPDDVDRSDALFPIYVKLARAHYWMVDGHLRWDSDAEDAISESYQAGMEYARIAIALNNDEWTRSLQYGTPIPDAVSTLTREDVPAVYWYATNVGRWALSQGIAEVLARKDDIFAMMSRVSELWPDYFYGAPNRYFGVYYTKLPFGNPALDQSLANFERAQTEHPEYFDNFTIFAEEYCRVTNNRERAEAALQTTVSGDPSALEEIIPENTNSQRKAQHMLDNIDEYFR